VVAVARQMMEDDERSFSFVSSYLIRCCRQMEKEGRSLNEI
jgi:hypothetical protein